jgi:2-polyprenyl-3-methyl-5-hydroxy-6-metoxy-1,4-benzoquinol methylase
MVWLDPIPVEEDIHHVYRTYYTHSSDAATTTSLRGRIREAVRSGYLRGALGYTEGAGASWHRHLRFLAHVYPTGPGSFESETMFLPAPRFPARLLDVGCGNGDLLVRMRLLGWDVEAVELDPIAVRTARTRGLEVRQGELQSQQYPADSFDAITMAHLIEHVYDPPRLVREAHRILKPGGTLVILTPNSESLGAHLYGQDWRGWEPPRHLQIFNVDNLRVTLECSSLVQINVSAIVRGARDILAASKSLRRMRMAGVDTVGARTYQNTLTHTALQLAERFLTVVNRRTGEEILAIAKKNT